MGTEKEAEMRRSVFSSLQARQLETLASEAKGKKFGTTK